MSTRSSVSFAQVYLQWARKVPPKYIYKELGKFRPSISTMRSLSSGTMPWETKDKYRWMSHGHYIRVVTCRELADAVQRDGNDRGRCLRYRVRQQQEARQEWGRYVITCSTLNASTISSNTSSLQTTTYVSSTFQRRRVWVFWCRSWEK